MARGKKKTEAPQVDIGAEIFASLRDLEKIKGIPVEYMVERLKQALTNAYRKDREDNRDIPAENVVVDLSEKGLSMHLVKIAVEEVEDPTTTIHIDAARNIVPTAQLGDNIIGRRNKGDEVQVPIETNDPSMDRHHCVLNVKRGKTGRLIYTLRDNDSITGTFLMNEVLGNKDRVRIEDGAIITLGATTLILHAAE